MNSVIQVPLTIKEFVNFLVNEKFICFNKEKTRKKFLCALSLTIHSCQKATSKSVIPQQLYNRFNRFCKNFDAYKQQDVHEFFVCLLELIKNDYKEINDVSKLESIEEEFPLSILFTGSSRVESSCLKCHSKT